MRGLFLLGVMLITTPSGAAEATLPAAPPVGAGLMPQCALASVDDLAVRLRAVVECYVDKGEFAGTVLVGRGDQVLLADGWGLANREWKVVNDVDTRFRLGSLTKAFTGVLVMRLLQDGKLSLSDPVGRYVSGLPEHVGERVTIRHLTTHTSGLQEFFRIPEFQRLWLYEPPSIEELFRAVAQQPLEFTPGERYQYRNIGYMALGQIVEQVTGLTYEQALQTYVLGPAKMDDSGVEQAGEIVERMATGYARVGEDWRKGSFLNFDIVHAAGGVFSTAPDLFLFSQALDTNELLDADLQQQMFTPQVKERQDQTDHRHYAFGWHIDRLDLGEAYPEVEIVEHGGDVTSFETLFTRVPALNAVVVILYNHGETDQNAIRDDLVRLLLASRAR